MRDEYPAVLDGIDRSAQVSIHAGLEDIARGARIKGRANKLQFFVHSEEDDFRRTLIEFQLTGDFEAIQLTHGDIKDENVGLDFGGLANDRAGLAEFADDLEVLLKYVLDSIEDGGIVVGEKYAKPFSHSKLHCSSRGVPIPEHLRRWHEAGELSKLTVRPTERYRLLLRDHVVLDRVFDQPRAGLDAENIHDPVLVESHSARLELEDVGDFLHGLSFRKELEDLALTA